MNTPSIHVIRHWIAWGPSDDCPDELIEHDSNRLDQFEAWLAEVKAQAVAEWLAERMAAFEKADLEAYRQGETE